MGDDDIKNFIKTKKSNISELEVYGPHKIGQGNVWEIWFHDRKDDEYKTNYVIHKKNELAHFDSFGSLAAQLGTEFENLGSQVSEIGTKKITLYVASITFLATVATFLFLVSTKSETPFIIVTVLLGVIASGCALFFGRWIPITAKQEQ